MKGLLPVLLISPFKMPGGKGVLSILNIEKKGQAIHYNTIPLTQSLVRREFRDLPKPLRDELLKSSGEALEEARIMFQKSWSNRKNGPSAEEFMHSGFIRYWHGILEACQPYFPVIKWYHQKQRPDKKNLLTAPCRFSNFKPRLKFEVVKNEGALQLKTGVLIHNDTYALEIFTRTHFLLESKNEFFVLTYRDYLTLERLEKENPEEYAGSPDQFALKVLAPLEEHYKVNRNDCFPRQELEVIPVNRLMLSELNNAFLMLTPQWIYDGHVTDGQWRDCFEVTKEGKVQVIKRHKETESRFIQTLVGLHPDFAGQRNGYYYLSFANAQKKRWFQKVYQQLLEMDIEIVGMDMLRHFRFSEHLARTEMKKTGETDHRVIFEMELCFGKEKVPLNELQRMLLAGQKAVLLKDGSLGILSDEWLQTYATMVKHSRVKDNTIEVLKWMAIAGTDGGKQTTALSSSIRDAWWNKWQQWQVVQEPVYPLPAAVKAVLRPYQQKGFEWILLLHEIGAGACLADDMGLGKTLQAICALVYFMEGNPRPKNLVICPASLIYNWQQEFNQFAPGIRTLVYHGPARLAEQLTEPEVQVIITTYHTLRSDIDLIRAQSFGAIVLDESHNIKNPATQVAQAVLQLDAVFRIALSGTPVVNNTFDLYMQLHFAVPGMFGNREFFKREYADPIDNFQDEERTGILKKLTAPFILRRTKEQVAKDLPEKTESILWCEMEGLQRMVYEEIMEQTRGNIFLEIEKSGFAKSKFSILQGITKLRQVCCSPLLLKDGTMHHCSESVKTSTLMNELSNIPDNHKALVFSQFSSMLDLLAEECKKRGLAFYHFDGGTPPDKRSEMVKAFQDPDNKVNLFLISLKAGNTGLTLTAADYVFLYDPWWNTAVETQAIDRTHRIGQTKSVFAYKMICKDTIEEKIITLQQRKKKLSEELVSADEGFVKSLTEEEVKFLFS